MKINSFEDLNCWKLAREVNKDIFKIISNSLITNDFPLKNQMNRSAGSIMDNIAEGFERNGNKEFIQFVSISKGSCGELKSQLMRAFDRNYISKIELDNIYKKLDLISKMCSGLIKYLKECEQKGWKYKDTK